MSGNSYRQQPPPSLSTERTSTSPASRPPTSPVAPMDEEYDYRATSPKQPKPTSDDAMNTTDEALMDLAQLEELHVEAEKMKAIGNKHMAAQVGFVS